MTAPPARTLAALALVLAACSSSTNPEASSPASRPAPTSAAPTTATTPTTVTATGVAAATTAAPVDTPATDPVATDVPLTSPPATTSGTGAATDEPYVSPLDEYLGSGSITTDFDPAEYQRENQKMEEAIAVCMNEQGFEYIPYAPALQFLPVISNGQVAAVSSAGALGAGLSDEEFAAQYGYGISTRDAAPGGDTEVDPNGAIVDGLSVSGRVAYFRALYGPDVSLQDDGHLAHKELPHDENACWQKASDEVFGTVQPVDNSTLDAFAPLLDEIGSLTDRELADPRMTAALGDWSNCMADAGYPGYTDLNKPRQDVADRAAKVLGTAMDPTTADPQELAEVRTEEIAIATADLHCHVAYDATFLTVAREIETKFVEDNRAQLEQYRDALAAAGDGG